MITPPAWRVSGQEATSAAVRQTGAGALDVGPGAAAVLDGVDEEEADEADAADEADEVLEGVEEVGWPWAVGVDGGATTPAMISALTISAQKSAHRRR